MFVVCYFVEYVGFWLFRQLNTVLLIGYMKYSIRLRLSDQPAMEHSINRFVKIITPAEASDVTCCVLKLVIEESI